MKVAISRRRVKHSILDRLEVAIGHRIFIYSIPQDCKNIGAYIAHAESL